MAPPPAALSLTVAAGPRAASAALTQTQHNNDDDIKHASKPSGAPPAAARAEISQQLAVTVDGSPAYRLPSLSLRERLLLTLAAPLMLAYWLLAFALAWLATLTVLPSVVLAQARPRRDQHGIHRAHARACS
jgi:hypothetical protein